jgi:hypothetical protein
VPQLLRHRYNFFCGAFGAISLGKEPSEIRRDLAGVVQTQPGVNIFGDPCVFDFLSFEHVIHTIEEKQEIRALTERINLKSS